jgi:hypothetical protein
MGATSKRAKKIRTGSEFDLIRLAAETRAPKVSSGTYAWDLDAIRSARDSQMIGRFMLPARLAESTRTDYAIFASFLNRLAPQRGLPVKLEAANDTARAVKIRDEAEALFGRGGVGIHPDTLSDIDGTLANHGVAFAVNTVTPREDGSRVDFEVKSWPIEFVRWDPIARAYCTQTENRVEEYICHGDGRWIVFQEHEHEPWKYGALLAVAILWADHAFGIRDRAKASTAHGNAKVVGTMPEGVPLQGNESGGLTQEAQSFLDLIRAIASVDTPAGIKPAGSTIDYITNGSRAWEIFKEIISSGDKAADRIYLGHDVTATAAGGDAVGYLFGVRNDIVEGSLRAIERGLRTGAIEPWTAINFGDSSLAPSRIYLMPDADEDARRKSLADRTSAFHEAVKRAKDNGFDVTQSYLDALAADFGIISPKLPVEANRAPTITLAPTDVAKVVRVNEARASAGLGPLTLPTGAADPDGMLTVAAFSAKQDAIASNPTPTGVVPPQAPSSGSGGTGPVVPPPLRIAQ